MGRGKTSCPEGTQSTSSVNKVGLKLDGIQGERPWDLLPAAKPKTNICITFLKLKLSLIYSVHPVVMRTLDGVLLYSVIHDLVFLCLRGWVSG